MLFWLFMSFYNDFHFFSFDYSERVHFYISNGNPNAKVFYFVCKIFTLLLVNYLRFLMVDSIEEIFLKQNNDKLNEVLLIIGLLVIYVMVAVLVYPGIWWANDADEFTTLSFAKNLQVQYHQGVIQSIFYVIALMIYPHPFSIILLQIILGAGVLGNIIWDNYQHNKKKYELVLLFLLCITPCCLYFAVYPMRAWMFTIFYFSFCYRVYESVLYDSFNRKTVLTIICSLLLAINYRTECKFLVLLVPFVLLIYMWKKHVNLLKPIIFIILLMGVSIVLCQALNQMGNQATKKTHPYLFLVAPLGNLLNDSNIDLTEYQDELDRIGVIFDLEKVQMSNGGDTSGEIDEIYYTEKEFYEGIKSLIRINVAHPINYVKNKTKNMLDSIGATNYRHVCYLFPDNIKPDNISHMFHLISPELHRRVAAFLAGDIKLGTVYLYYIWYAIWIPLLLSIIIGIICVIKKQYELLIPIILMLCETGVVVLFSPVHYTMYYFFAYIIGWFVVIEYLSNREIVKMIKH